MKKIVLLILLIYGGGQLTAQKHNPKYCSALGGVLTANIYDIKI